MEIEIKARCDDNESVVKKLLELGAIEEKKKHQIDEYYNHPSKDTRESNEYIRLRYKPGDNKAVFAHHINIADGVNKEFEVEVDNVATFKEILKNFGFHLLGTIDKKRKTYILDQFKITFDEVKDIDNFIEIEVEGEESEIDSKKAECMKLLGKIGLSEKNLCKGVWLCDIAIGKIKYDRNLGGRK